MNGNEITRRTAREWAVQMLTSADLNPTDDIRRLIDGYWEQLSSLTDEEGVCAGYSKRYRAFAEARVIGVIEHLQEIDEILKPQMDNWDLYRLGTVERCVLRLGVWEMKFAGVPIPVVINECVDLANWFSSPKSRTFVNGVLDALAKTLV